MNTTITININVTTTKALMKPMALATNNNGKLGASNNWWWTRCEQGLNHNEVWKRTKPQLGVNNDQTTTRCKHNTLANQNTTTNCVASNYCTTRANQNMTIGREPRGGWWTQFCYATRKTNTSDELKHNKKLCRRQLLHSKGEPKHDDQEVTKRTIMNLMMLRYKEDEN
jgi:hypothetical protein